jgi:hypothetical protein
MPSPSVSRLRLTPFLARSVGFFPVFFPPEGCLGHAPVHRQPRPVDPLPVIVGHQARLPQGLEDALFHPALEAIVGGGTGAEAGGIEGLPLAAGAQHEEDGFHADAIGGGGLAAAERMCVQSLRDQFGDGQPQIIGNAPLVYHRLPLHEGSPASTQLSGVKCSCTKKL